GNRCILREYCEIRQLFGIGQRQWWHDELVLGSHVQHLPARHQYLELWASHEQGCYLLCRAHHLLEVVQQQQHVLLSQFFLQAVLERLANSFPEAERLDDCRHHKGRIADRSKIHEKHSIGQQDTQFC